MKITELLELEPKVRRLATRAVEKTSYVELARASQLSTPTVYAWMRDPSKDIYHSTLLKIYEGAVLVMGGKEGGRKKRPQGGDHQLNQTLPSHTKTVPGN